MSIVYLTLTTILACIWTELTSSLHGSFDPDCPYIWSYKQRLYFKSIFSMQTPYVHSRPTRIIPTGHTELDKQQLMFEVFPAPSCSIDIIWHTCAAYAVSHFNPTLTLTGAYGLTLTRIGGQKCWLACHDRDFTASAVTRIRTWVVSATTRSTNHYTITAIPPAAGSRP